MCTETHFTYAYCGCDGGTHVRCDEQPPCTMTAPEKREVRLSACCSEDCCNEELKPLQDRYQEWQLRALQYLLASRPPSGAERDSRYPSKTEADAMNAHNGEILIQVRYAKKTAEDKHSSCKAIRDARLLLHISQL